MDSLPARTRLATASDYNRAIPSLLRWVHVGLAAVAITIHPFLAWVGAPERRHWAIPLVIGVAAFLLGPMLFGGAIDLAIFDLARSPHIGGDIRRELETLQQWGAVGSVVIASVIIWQVDPRRRRRLLDFYAAMLVLTLVVNAMKLLIGRPRPRAGVLGADGELIRFPGEVLWPWGAWPIEGHGVRHAWEFWAGISSDLWSMPSSHTSAAVAMSVFVAMVYPRLRGLAIVMAAIVGSARVILGAHYPSDVVVGACVGYAVAYPAIRGRWGQRALAGLRRQGRTKGVH